MPATKTHMPIKEARCINCTHYIKYKQFCVLKQEKTKRYNVCLNHLSIYRNEEQ